MKMNVSVKLNTGAIMAKERNAKNRAIIDLKQAIAQSTNKYVPLGTSGSLRNSVMKDIGSTNPKLTWDTPYAHFQWYGKVMIGSKSHSPWAHHGETKIYTSRDLTYSQGGKDWINKAMDAFKSRWINVAKRSFKEHFQ